MPTGWQGWPTTQAQPIVPPVGAPAGGPGAVPGVGGPSATRSPDVWRNFSLDPGAATWPGGIARVDFGAPITILEVFALAADEFWVGWNGEPKRPPSGTGMVAGGYNLYHPGLGQLVEVIPHVSTIWIGAKTSAGPGGRVEVIGRGGAYGVAWPGSIQQTAMLPGMVL